MLLWGLSASLLLLATGTTLAAAQRRALTAGWYPWDPYDYAEVRGGARHMTGLDVELVRAALAQSKRQLDIVDMPWREQLQRVGQGGIDLVTGATGGVADRARVLISAPYRQEIVQLFVTEVALRGYVRIKRSAEVFRTLNRELGPDLRSSNCAVSHSTSTTSERAPRSMHLLAVDSSSLSRSNRKTKVWPQ